MFRTQLFRACYFLRCRAEALVFLPAAAVSVCLSREDNALHSANTTHVGLPKLLTKNGGKVKIADNLTVICTRSSRKLSDDDDEGVCYVTVSERVCVVQRCFIVPKIRKIIMSSGPEQQKHGLKIDDTTRKLKKTEIDFMRLIEQQNLQRVQKLQRQRRNNKITALALGGSVLGIYLYSMYSVKQERFLDDFEEPLKVEVPDKQ
ncbi:hypothetical protein RP20_CCG015022 [Aedes albopictus]|nr:hypothetical protein RP20_CCG015022 [Aedes albopictus]